MNAFISQNRGNIQKHSFAAAAVVALLLGSASLAWAERNPNPGIHPPGSTPYGDSYGEWGGAWWQWTYSIPAAINPVSDPTGEFASVGQSGPVWFLAGNFGGTTVRTSTVPAAKPCSFPSSTSFGSTFRNWGMIPGLTSNAPLRGR